MKEYRFDISIITEEELNPKELILKLIESVATDDREIIAAPIPNPPHEDYHVQEGGEITM